MFRTLTLAALAAVIVAPSARAQVTPARPNTGQPGTTVRPNASQPGTVARPAANEGGTAARMAVNDSLFAAAAADAGLAEVTIGELGVQRATDPDLKRFSQKMIDEHTRMNQELMTVAAQRRIPLPRAIDARAKFCAESLAGLSGEDFDRCYAKAQLVAHMDSVAAFEAEAERGLDPNLKAFASKSLSHIKEHLQEIKPIAMKYEKEKPAAGNTR
jgi:putative membrane protein